MRPPTRRVDSIHYHPPADAFDVCSSSLLVFYLPNELQPQVHPPADPSHGPSHPTWLLFIHACMHAHAQAFKSQSFSAPPPDRYRSHPFFFFPIPSHSMAHIHAHTHRHPPVLPRAAQGGGVSCRCRLILGASPPSVDFIRSDDSSLYLSMSIPIHRQSIRSDDSIGWPRSGGGRRIRGGDDWLAWI